MSHANNSDVMPRSSPTLDEGDKPRSPPTLDQPQQLAEQLAQLAVQSARNAEQLTQLVAQFARNAEASAQQGREINERFAQLARNAESSAQQGRDINERFAQLARNAESSAQQGRDINERFDKLSLKYAADQKSISDELTTIKAALAELVPKKKPPRLYGRMFASAVTVIVSMALLVLLLALLAVLLGRGTVLEAGKEIPPPTVFFGFLASACVLLCAAMELDRRSHA